MTSEEDTPFKKLNKDMKKHFAKLSADVSTFFQKPPSQSSASAEGSHEDQEMERSFADFKHSSDATYQELEADWIKRHDARTEKLQQSFQKRHEKRVLREKIRHARIERNRKRRQAFLADQREKWMASTKKTEVDIRERKIQRRDDRQENKLKAQRNWDRAALRRQKGVQNAFKSVSRFGWKVQLRFVMLIVPLLVVFIVVYILLKPFLV